MKKKEHKGAKEKNSSDKYLTTLLDSLDVAFSERRVATLFKGLLINLIEKFSDLCEGWTSELSLRFGTYME